MYYTQFIYSLDKVLINFQSLHQKIFNILDQKQANYINKAVNLMDRLFSKPAIISKSKRQSPFDNQSSQYSYSSNQGHSTSVQRLFQESPEVQLYLDRRIHCIAETLAKLNQRVEADELYSTLSRDSNTQQFAFDRLKEIILQDLKDEREQTIQELALNGRELTQRNEVLLGNIGELQLHVQEKEIQLEEQRKKNVRLEQELTTMKKHAQQLVEKLEELKSDQMELEREMIDSVPLKEHKRIIEEKDQKIKEYQQQNFERSCLKENKQINYSLQQINRDLQLTLKSSVNQLESNLGRNLSKGLRALIKQAEQDKETIMQLQEQLRESHNNELGLIRMNKAYQEEIDILAVRLGRKPHISMNKIDHNVLHTDRDYSQNSTRLNRLTNNQSTDIKSHVKSRSTQSYRQILRDGSPYTTSFAEMGRNNIQL